LGGWLTHKDTRILICTVSTATNMDGASSLCSRHSTELDTLDRLIAEAAQDHVDLDLGKLDLSLRNVGKQGDSTDENHSVITATRANGISSTSAERIPPPMPPMDQLTGSQGLFGTKARATDSVEGPVDRIATGIMDTRVASGSNNRRKADSVGVNDRQPQAIVPATARQRNGQGIHDNADVQRLKR